MFNHLCLFLLVFTQPFLAFAQNQAAKERPKIGTISGIIIDEETNTPLPYSSVSLFNQRDSTLVTGAISDDDGKFTITEVPIGLFFLKIQFIGYQTERIDSIRITPQNRNIKLETINILPNTTDFQDVEIEGKKDVFRTEIDKRIFDVTDNVLAEGGTAVDLLQTIPSVSVDMDGNIAFRGSGNVLIYIDGRPSGLTGEDRSAVLDQIPASSIEKIEFITNPSAKYDAEGVGGIINIVLKKNKLSGFNGSASMSAGTNHKYNPTLSLNYKHKKWNLFSNYSFRYSEFYNENEYDRENRQAGQTSYFRRQGEGDNTSLIHLVRAGAEFQANDKNKIGTIITYRSGYSERREELEFRDLDASENLTDLFYRHNTRSGNNKNLEATLTYDRTFEREDQNLNASATYSAGVRDQDFFFNEIYYNLDETPSSEDPLRQIDQRDFYNHVITLQADYEQNFSKDRPKEKLEAGYKSILRQVDNDFQFGDFQEDLDRYLLNPLLNNDLLFQEDVHSVYANYGNQHERFGYQLGARLEQTFMSTEVETENAYFENNYLNFFPSVFLTYETKKQHQFQLSYSRRVNRPGPYQLSPFVDRSDPNNLRTGNPTLLPEFTNSSEISYLRSWDKFFLTSSFFYRITNGVIQRVISLNEENIASVTFENLNNRNDIGFEFIAKNDLTKRWNITTTYNLFRTSIDGGNIPGTMENSNLTWTLSVLSNLTVPKWFQVQFNANYTAPRATAQGMIKEIFFMNIGLKRNILDNKGSLSFNLTDILNTRRFLIETEGTNFTQDLMFNRETRIATLTFSYRFGKQERRPQRKRSNNEGRSGGGQDIPDF